MREKLLERLKHQNALRAVDADFEHLLGSWFNPGFLTMRQLDWGASASLLERIIQHEAVHAIDGWNDLRRRLQPDRRLFAFFHPMLPEEPLIFVEVALLDHMPSAIAPLLDRSAQPQTDARRFKLAAFYSISNCQPGLRGISLGNFLIKRVAQQLQKEHPALRMFCTLSPIPSFMPWLAKVDEIASARLKPATVRALNDELKHVRSFADRLPELMANDADHPVALSLRRLCAFFLVHRTTGQGEVGDPVARFHLNNGASLDRINSHADMSRKGLKQSAGLMVNYLYDLEAVEDNHQRFVQGEVVAGKTVQRLIS
jgi:malonyl-CoA decarboxylase